MLVKFDNVIRKIGDVIATCSLAFFCILMLLTVADILLRYLFSKPIPGTLEIGTAMLPWIVFLGFAFALAKGLHVRLTLITDRLSPRVKLWLDILAYVLGFALCVTMTYLGWNQFWKSISTGEFMLAPVPVPWWIGKMAFPIGMFVVSLQYLSSLLLMVRKTRTKEALAGERATVINVG